MKVRFLSPIGLLALGMCSTLPGASCESARVAAQLATIAMARICPISGWSAQ